MHASLRTAAVLALLAPAPASRAAGPTLDREPRGACPIPYAIVAVEPATMQVRDLHAGGGAVGCPHGRAQIGNRLFIGSFAGDRVLRVDLAGE